MAALVGGALLAVLLKAIWSVKPGPAATTGKPHQSEQSPPTAAPLGMALLGIRTDRLDPAAAPEASAGMCGYLLAFEIISVHLLVVLVGAAYLPGRNAAGGNARRTAGASPAATQADH